MISLPTFLKIVAPIFGLVSLMHLVLGPSAEILLGANLGSALSDPVLDSQNRFYGVSFGLYGALFYLCSKNLEAFSVVFYLTLAFFFAGGLARLVSVSIVGWPSSWVIALMCSELLLPPLLYIWSRFSKWDGST